MTSTLSHKTELEEVAYPPAPWEMTGQLWMGGFRLDTPIPLPDGLKAVDARLGLLTLVRYQSGTLQYDELVIGALVRKGWRIGIWVHYIWVDSLPSVWGGRRIWGLPKDMAEFNWNGNTVSVSDRDGAIASLEVDMSESRLPSIWIPAPGFGQLDGDWIFTNASMWMSFATAGMRLKDWSPRFPYRPKQEKPVFAMAGKPFRLKVPAGVRLNE